MMMSTKCAASTRGIVRMVALPRACCRRALRPALWKAGTPHPSITVSRFFVRSFSPQ